MTPAASLAPPQPASLSARPTRTRTSSTAAQPGPADGIAARRQRVQLDRLFKLNHPPGYYDESARVALLRRSRRGPHDQLLVEFAGSEVLTELTAADRVVWSHLWQWEATVAGQALVATGPWSEVCWHTDADVDYLEIELPLTGGWRLERQFVLGRKDRFVLLADALLGPASGSEPLPPGSGLPSATPEIRYASTISLASGVSFAAAGETREGWLAASRKKIATLVPLALPEWRAEMSPAELSCGADNTLVLMQAAQGHALYAPLWIDLDPERARQPLTWRRLAVAENLQTVGRDTAVGYRVQIGQQQWLVYRTLAPRGNRTVLGQNYSSEFVCCRFLRSGKTEDIIEIQ